MSYCRFSSMNWKCDVYVYEDVSGGWTTHVAGSRRIWPIVPDIPWGRLPRFGGEWAKDQRTIIYPTRWHKLAARTFYGLAAFWHSKIHMNSVLLSPRRTLGLPHDGASFNDPTPRECAERLEGLRSLGYTVPQYAIDALREEGMGLLEDD